MAVRPSFVRIRYLSGSSILIDNVRLLSAFAIPIFSPTKKEEAEHNKYWP